MRTYKETAERVLARRDEYEAEKKRKTIVMRRRLIPVAAAALVAVGAGAFALSGNNTPGAAPKDETGVISANNSAPAGSGAETDTKDAGYAGNTEGAGGEDTMCGVGYWDADGNPIEFNDEEQYASVSDDDPDVYIDEKGEKHIIPSDESSAEVAIIPKWEDMSFWEQYSSLDRKGFTSASYELDSSEVGDGLGDVILTGYDVYEDKSYELPGEAFEIKGISPDCAIAVKAQGHEGCGVFLNFDYSPETLGQFIDDLDLENTLELGVSSITAWDDEGYTTSTYVTNGDYEPITDTAQVLRMISTDREVKNSGDDIPVESGVAYIEIGVDIPKLGIRNIALWMSEDGWLQTNILATRKSFYLGEDKVRELESYLKDNYFEKSHKTYYNDDTPILGGDIPE